MIPVQEGSGLVTSICSPPVAGWLLRQADRPGERVMQFPVVRRWWPALTWTKESHGLELLGAAALPVEFCGWGTGMLGWVEVYVYKQPWPVANSNDNGQASLIWVRRQVPQGPTINSSFLSLPPNIASGT